MATADDYGSDGEWADASDVGADDSASAAGAMAGAAPVHAIVAPATAAISGPTTANSDPPRARHRTYGVAPGDGEILPPRFDGDDRTDAVNWADDFAGYLALRHINEQDAAILLRNRLTGAARTWADSLPTGTPVADILTRLRRRFGAEQTSSDFWYRCQGTSETARAYIAAKFRLAQRMNLADDKFTIDGIVQGLRADIRPKVMMARPTSVEELIDVAAVAERAVRQGLAATANLATADDVASLKAAISAIAATVCDARPPGTQQQPSAAEPPSYGRGRGRRDRGRGRPWSSGPRPTAATNRQPMPTTTTADPVCRQCGWQSHENPADCPARLITCHECQATGHYARCCPRRATSTPSNTQ